jgi:hypothetical protein
MLEWDAHAHPIRNPFWNASLRVILLDFAAIVVVSFYQRIRLEDFPFFGQSLQLQ